MGTLDISIESSLSYKDVLLVPQYSDIKHRSDVDTSSRLFRYGSTFAPIKIPVIGANMTDISTFEMIKEMYHHGGICFLHRYQSGLDTIKLIKKLVNNDITRIVPSIGVGDDQADLAITYLDKDIEAINIDIAHGHSKIMGDTIKKIKFLNKQAKIIAGNITTPEGAAYLWECGADVIKVGIANGAACSTKNMTGIGYPQFSAIKDIASIWDYNNRPTIIADGGIKEFGDIAKAIGAGADFVMVGSMLAGCPETGTLEYSGMASEKVQKDFKGWAKNIEGKTTVVDKKPPVGVLLQTIKESLQSSFSYCNARNIKQFHENAQFVIVKS